MCYFNITGAAQGYVNRSDINRLDPGRVAYALEHKQPLDCMWVIQVEEGWKVSLALFFGRREPWGIQGSRQQCRLVRNRRHPETWSVASVGPVVAHPRPTQHCRPAGPASPRSGFSFSRRPQAPSPLFGRVLAGLSPRGPGAPGLGGSSRSSVPLPHRGHGLRLRAASGRRADPSTRPWPSRARRSTRCPRACSVLVTPGARG